MKAEFGFDAQLACWDPEQRAMKPVPDVRP
jgi:hypothetical protein